MDGLTVIAIAMTAILFSWVGYFLGIFFPTFGKSKRLKDARKASGEKLIDLSRLGRKSAPEKKKGEPSFLQRGWKKTVDWLLEREEEPAEELPVEELEEVSVDILVAQEPEAAPEPRPFTPDLPDEPQLEVPLELSIPEDAILLWHDRANKKLFARVGKDVVDLDSDLSKQQHGDLSMLLVDLQDRVGISAALKQAIADGTEKVYADKELKDKVASLPTDEPLKGPSFNPVKTFLNYVKADVPKLEDKPDSIPSQINRFLQENIEGSPLQDQGISVAEWPTRGVVFIVGIDVYDSIDLIPDPAVQEAIRTAVSQWEESEADRE